MQKQMSDGQPAVQWIEGVERCEASGLSGAAGRLRTRLAVEATRGGPVLTEQVGRTVLVRESIVAKIEGEAWADTSARALVVKCGPLAPAEVDRMDDRQPRWVRQAAVDRGSGRPIPDWLGRLHIGVDLSRGMADPAQQIAVTQAWPLLDVQRQWLGAGTTPKTAGWHPLDRRLFVVAVGGWVPPGYVGVVQRIEPVGGGRYRVDLTSAAGPTAAERGAYEGRWLATRPRVLVDLVDEEVR